VNKNPAFVEEARWSISFEGLIEKHCGGSWRLGQPQGCDPRWVVSADDPRVRRMRYAIMDFDYLARTTLGLDGGC